MANNQISTARKGRRMTSKQRLNLSQKQHVRLWRETINGNSNDSLNHSYHAKAISNQSKKGRILTKKEKKVLYSRLKRK